MRIAVLVHRFPVLSETFIIRQVVDLLELGHDVHIIADGPPDDPVDMPELERFGMADRVHYLRMPRNRLLRFAKTKLLAWRYLLKYPWQTFIYSNVFIWKSVSTVIRNVYTAHVLRQLDPMDVLHCHFGPLGIVGAVMKHCKIVPKVAVTLHGYDMSSYLQQHGEGVYQHMLQTADRLLPVSEFWRNKLQRMGADASRIIVHRMGIDTEALQLSERSNLPGRRILMAGRFVEKKGIAEGIAAFAQIADDMSGVQLRVIGDGPLRGEFEQSLVRLNLQGRVNLLGSCPHDVLLDELRRASVFVAPSVTAADGDMEGLPVVLMEAMAFGTPVVATRHSGIPELLRHEVTGLLADEHDVAGLAGCIRRILSEPDEAETMARRGRELVEQQHNSKRLVQELVDILTAM
jgi:colanic acid/amylovoran biosynthesis glycosyltransferase